jgi:membrane associated rhomboid family serine protease
VAFRSNGPVMVALPPFRGVTRRIILLAVGVFFALLVLGIVSRDLSGLIAGLFALQSDLALHKLVWQFVTYPFITTGIFGLLFAALTVWFFGSALEEELGSRWMAEFFFVSTIGGGLVASIISLLVGDRVAGMGPGHPADSLWPFSLALLLAFARLHPDQELNFNFILRVKAKYIAGLYLLVYLAIMLAAHLRFDAMVVITNALCGWLYLRFAPRRGIGFAGSEGLYGLRNAWYRAKRRRAAKKFTVYMQKQGRDVRFDESGRYLDPDAERRDPRDRKWMN